MLFVVVCDRTPRYTSRDHDCRRTVSDNDIFVGLTQLFTAFDIAKQCQTSVRQASDNNSFTTDSTSVKVEVKDENLLRYSRNVEVMLQCFGFVVERRPSTLKLGGTGVLVTNGTVPAGVVTSLYPGITLLSTVALT